MFDGIASSSPGLVSLSASADGTATSRNSLLGVVTSGIAPPPPPPPQQPPAVEIASSSRPEASRATSSPKRGRGRLHYIGEKKRARTQISRQRQVWGAVGIDELKGMLKSATESTDRAMSKRSFGLGRAKSRSSRNRSTSRRSPGKKKRSSGGAKASHAKEKPAWNDNTHTDRSGLFGGVARTRRGKTAQSQSSRRRQMKKKRSKAKRQKAPFSDEGRYADGIERDSPHWKLWRDINAAANDLRELVKHFDPSRTGCVSVRDVVLCLNAVGVFPKPASIVEELCESLKCMKLRPHGELGVVYEALLTLVPKLPEQHSFSKTAGSHRLPKSRKKTPTKVKSAAVKSDDPDESRESVEREAKPAKAARPELSSTSAKLSMDGEFPHSLYGASRFSAADLDVSACHSFTFHKHDIFEWSSGSRAPTNAGMAGRETKKAATTNVQAKKHAPASSKRQQRKSDVSSSLKANDILMDASVIDAAVKSVAKIFKSKGMAWPLAPAGDGSDCFKFIDGSDERIRLGILSTGHIVVVNDTGFTDLLRYISHRSPKEGRDAEKKDRKQTTSAVSEARIKSLAESVVDERTKGLRSMVSAMLKQPASMTPEKSSKEAEHFSAMRKAMSLLEMKENKLIEKWLSPQSEQARRVNHELKRAAQASRASESNSNSTPGKVKTYRVERPTSDDARGTPVQLISPLVLSSIESGKRRFARHRALAEASLSGSGMPQWRLVECVADLVINDVILKAGAELFEASDEYADSTFNSI